MYLIKIWKNYKLAILEFIATLTKKGIKYSFLLNAQIERVLNTMHVAGGHILSDKCLMELRTHIS